MKKLILIPALIATFSLAEKLPNYKTSLGLMGGGIEGSIASVNERALIGGLTWKTEKRIKNTNIYYGVGVDFLQSTDFEFGRINNKKVEGNINSIGLYPTIGYQFNKKISTNIMIGGAYNKFELEYDGKKEDESKLGFLYGASIDYAIGESMTHGIFYRATTHSLSDTSEKFKTQSLLYRIAISF